MAAMVFTVGHKRTITYPQAVAHAGAEGAEARLWSLSPCIDLKIQPVSAGASLPLLILCRRRNEVGAAGSFLHREEERTVAAAVHHISSVPLPVTVSALLTYNMETQSAVQKASVPLQRRPLLSISPLVFSVHSEETEHHQIKEGPNNS